MNRPWFWNLILLAAVAVAGARLYDASKEPLPSLPGPPESPPHEKVVIPAPPEQGGENYEEIVAQNLFNATRKPAEIAPPVEVKAPPVKKAPPPKVTLFGVMLKDSGEKVAFLQSSGEGASAKPRPYREGDTLSGGKVKEIQSDRVSLDFSGSEVVVSLRTPKEGAANFSPPSPAPTRTPPVRAEPPRQPRTPVVQKGRTRPGLSRDTADGRNRQAQRRAIQEEEDYYDDEDYYYDDEEDYYLDDEDYDEYYDDDEDYYLDEELP